METLPTRIGVLVPSLDPVVEHDLQRFLPAAASFHVGRLPQSPQGKTATDEGLTRMCDSAPEAARPLAELGAKLILFCCTSASFFRGYGADRALAAQIQDAVGVPALTTSTAVAEVLSALDVQRAFMVTPYRREVNQREQAFFNAHGVEIPAFTSFECQHSHDIDKVTPAEIVARVLENRTAIEACEAVFVSCTALRSMETIERLERELDRPVVTSNAATLWSALARLELDASAVPGGRLFRLPTTTGPVPVA